MIDFHVALSSRALDMTHGISAALLKVFEQKR
jgi:hypothetical protein